MRRVPIFFGVLLGVFPIVAGTNLLPASAQVHPDVLQLGKRKWRVVKPWGHGHFGSELHAAGVMCAGRNNMRPDTSLAAIRSTSGRTTGLRAPRSRPRTPHSCRSLRRSVNSAFRRPGI